ncbi:MAG: ATP synthase F1 subunit epsilon [Treponema sp.]|nr:ATP synthase F1 subunit epsilon [Treponema sp.]
MMFFNFEVHTPYRLFFFGKAQAVILQLIDGEICVYANHSPFTSLSVSGQLQIKDEEGKWRSAFIAKGILEVKEHKNVLMVDAAEWPEEIDKERALISMQDAEKALKDKNFKFEIDKSKEKLRRANYRLKVAGHY